MNRKIIQKQKGFTLVELLVVVAIIALLVSILLPALGQARDQAKNVMCKSNLRQWGLIFQLYTDDNREKFPSGWYTNQADTFELWMTSMSDYYEDIYEFCCCPKANNPAKKFTEDPIYGVWGPYTSTDPDKYKDGIYGSYGINEWIYNNSGTESNSEGGTGTAYKAEYYWGKTDPRYADSVPVLMDCGTYEIMPQPSDAPPATESFYTWNSPNPYGEMGRCMINRHGKGEVNMVMMDWSVQSIEFGNLWKLKWNRIWTPKEPTTWPTWMNKY